MNNLNRVSPQSQLHSKHASSEAQLLESSIRIFKESFEKFILDNQINRSKVIDNIIKELEHFSNDNIYFSANSSMIRNDSFLQMIIGDNHPEPLKAILQNQQAVSQLKEWLNNDVRYTAAQLEQQFKNVAPAGQGAKKNFYNDSSGKGFTKVRNPNYANAEYKVDDMLQEYLTVLGTHTDQMNKHVSLL